MKDDDLEMFTEDSDAAPGSVAETQEVDDEPPAEPEQEPEQVEGTGETEPAAEGEEEAGPPPAQEERHQNIPVTALLDEREKRQAAERRAEDAARRLQQIEQQVRAAQQQKPKPDWFEDPQAAAQYQQQFFEAQLQRQALAQSRFMAEREFGQEAVAEVISYFDRRPELSAQFLSEPSPFHAAVDFYNRQKLLDDIGADPAAYRDRLREELRKELVAEMATAQPSKPKAPPPSMAKAPSAGGPTPVRVEAPPDLDGLFNG